MTQSYRNGGTLPARRDDDTTLLVLLDNSYVIPKKDVHLLGCNSLKEINEREIQ